MGVWRRRQQEGGLALSRSVGDFHLFEAGVVAEPELQIHTLDSQDHFIVLGSDGVFDHLSNAQIVQLVARSASSQDAAQAIVKAARRMWMQEGGGYIDDVTAVVVHFRALPPRAPRVVELVCSALLHRRVKFDFVLS